MDFGSIYHVMMARDGICLSGDVYLPMDGGESYPVVLFRTELARGRFSELFHALNKAGIGVYVQSVRGRFGSEGVFEPYIHEGEDGLEAYQWLVRQPWCNGTVFGFGAGYSGQALLSMWENGGGHGMAGAVIAGCGNDLERRGFRSNGVSVQLWLRQALEWAVDEPYFRGNPMEIQRLKWECSLMDAQSTQPFRKGATLLRHTPGIENWYWRLSRELSDDDSGPICSGRDKSESGLFPDLPLLMLDGWYDVFCADALKRFQIMSNRNLSPLKLVVCAGLPDFERNENRDLGEVTLGTKAFSRHGGSLVEHTVDWFRHIMDMECKRDAPLDMRSIEFYQAGHLTKKDGIIREVGGRWHKAIAWPPDKVRFFSFYFQPDGGLALKKSIENNTATSFAGYPESPMPSFGGVGLVHGPRAGGMREAIVLVEGKGIGSNEMPLIYRKDVISFTTGTLKREMVIVGTPKVRLFVKSKTPSSDFAIVLADVLPDGDTTVCFCQGIARHKGMTNMVADGVAGMPDILQFDLPPVCMAIGVGHRIRVYLSASLFPMFTVNPNCATDMAAAGIMESTVNMVFHGGEPSSMILMPIVYEAANKESG